MKNRQIDELINDMITPYFDKIVAEMDKLVFTTELLYTKNSSRQDIISFQKFTKEFADNSKDIIQQSCYLLGNSLKPEATNLINLYRRKVAEKFKADPQQLNTKKKEIKNNVIKFKFT